MAPSITNVTDSPLVLHLSDGDLDLPAGATKDLDPTIEDRVVLLRLAQNGLVQYQDLVPDKTFSVAGVNADPEHHSRLMGLVEAEATIEGFQIDWYLEAEPDNPYDSQAIKVIANGERVGYVPKVEISGIRELAPQIANSRVKVYLSEWGEVDESGSIFVTLALIM